MNKFSLILATYGRMDTLDQLFSSIAAQTGEDFECIVIDQNEDDRLQPLIDRWQGALNMRVIRAQPQLSRARNQGIRAATGDIIAFPDDDCWYSPGLFRNIREAFAKNPEYEFLTTGMTDAAGVPSGNRWVQSQCEIAPINIFRASSTQTLFFRRTARFNAVRFDEAIGPNSGTIFGCGEDTDFVLEAIRAGMRGQYIRSLVVYHPRKDMLSGNADEPRAVSYGRGMGHVMRKHGMSTLWLAFIAYDMARALVCRLRGRSVAAQLCMAHARGIREGYLADFSAPHAVS